MRVWGLDTFIETKKSQTQWPKWLLEQTWQYKRIENRPKSNAGNLD